VSAPPPLLATSALPSASPAVLRAALEDRLLLPDPRPALQELANSGVLAIVLPEMAATIDLAEEGDRRHKDVWEHSKQVVLQSPARASLRWAAFLHDVGKVPTRSFLPDGRVCFHRHAEVGAAIFRRRIARRLELPPELADPVHFLILHHLRAGQYDETWQDSAVRRLSRDLGEHLPDLLDLSRADVTSRRPGRRAEALRLIDALERRIAELRLEDAREPPLPSGLGHLLMAAFGLAPGPLVGRLRALLERAVEEGRLSPGQPPEYYLAALRDPAIGTDLPLSPGGRSADGNVT
jgi:poly(A) polymerase